MQNPRVPVLWAVCHHEMLCSVCVVVEEEEEEVVVGMGPVGWHNGTGWGWHPPYSYYLSPTPSARHSRHNNALPAPIPPPPGGGRALRIPNSYSIFNNSIFNIQ
jgi:hypothetical protein